MDRRQFIAGSAAAVIMLRAGAGLARSGPPSGRYIEIALWDGAPPGGGGPAGDAKLSAKGALSNVVRPFLSVFRPQKPNGQAVLVAAGGGYRRIEMGHEAWPAAGWLVNLGYTAYVLGYRLPAEGWRDGGLVALQDAQRALRIVHSREKHVSALGFSAGGHLLGMAITRPDFRAYPALDALDNTPARADRAALIYPIITLEKPYDHSSTHKILVGPDATAAAEARWSVQNFVTRHTPPVFLAQADDDPIADPHNTLIMAAACRSKHVPVTMYRYSSGGHGFGMGKPGTPTLEWPARYQEWLRTAWETAGRQKFINE
ncbi:alpha/beta hydrolase [Acerihabitans arboris]|uniref:Prolyl oligopeptidase family serine peptidase n=1 Tax=Acerihabitans arboris TaxID=2691583 RepID=A0A845STD0_9GAMM|nr:alpha/beta hydrolase [Acerihabitans arboris]NDL65998.1 prolyl oligopeptidase family serine peptidase [Acerihabitans arboris]